MEQPQSGKIARAAGIISGATLVSRVLGFVRDMVIARTFGAGTVTDAFFAAFRLPNMLRELLGEGALSAAFIPVFTESMSRRGREGAWRLAWTVLSLLGLVLALVSLAGIALAPLLVRLVAPGFQSLPSKFQLAVLLTRVMFPYLMLVGVAALFMAILNAQGHFATPALSPTMLNVAMIGCAVWLVPHVEPGIMALALGVLIGGAGQLLIQVPVAWRLGMGVCPGLDLQDPDIGRIARLMAPGVAGLAITQVNVFIGTFLASFLEEGSISILYYAFRLIQFPIGMFGVAVATAAFPTMARQAAARSLDGVAATVAYSLRLVLFVTLPAMVGLLVFRVSIVQVLFERGAFDRTLTVATADAVSLYAVGLVAYVSTRVLVPAFYSLQDTRTPVRIGAIAVVANVLVSLALMRPLGVGGLALGTACSSFVNATLLLAVLRQRLGALGDAGIVGSLLRSGVASVIMAVAALGLLRLQDPVRVQPVPLRVAVLGAEVGLSLLVFLVVASRLGSRELRSLRRRLGPGEEVARYSRNDFD